MEGKEPRKDEEETNNRDRAAEWERSAKVFFKALIIIERQLNLCEEKERETQLAQKIRQVLAILQRNTRREIPGEIPVVQSSPAENPLQIAAVVRRVLRNLDSSFLLKSRLVCRVWENEATSQLLTERHENIFKIRFEWNKRKGKYLHKNKKTLQDFHETCGNESRASASANTRKFLCSQTKIVFKGGDLRLTRACFFNDFGVFVRFLSLKPEEEQTEEFQSNLHSILIGLTPNLHSLTFKTSWTLRDNSNNENSSSKWEIIGSGTGLEKLKVLKLIFFSKGAPGLLQRMHIQQQNSFCQMRAIFQYPRENPDLDRRASPSNAIIRKILERAPNLQWILNPDLAHTRQILALGKLHLVKHLDLIFPPMDSNLFLEFATANPKLSCLKLTVKKSTTRSNPNPTAEEIAALNSILQSSQSTLEHFQGVHHLKNLSGIQQPSFPLVKQLCLALDFDNSNENANASAITRILPSGFDFNHVFPNLVSLKIAHLQDSNGNPFNCVGTANPKANVNASSSLKHLEFAVIKDFSSFWMYRISSLYPTLSILHVKILGNFTLFPVVCKSIWSCLTQLTNVHLTVQIDPQRPSSHQGNGEDEILDRAENEETNLRDETDSIFTGFPLDLCRKLKQEESTLTMSDAILLEDLRESPSILHMKRLVELTISCVGIHPEKLWSQVTEILAFEKIKQRQNVKVKVTQRI